MGLDNETWKRASPFNYEVSNYGNVRKADTKRQIKPITKKDGYQQISFWDSKNKHVFYLHRVVGKLFVPGYFDGAVIDHIDGNRSNNKASNLRWMSQKENIWESFKFGKQHRKAREVYQIKDGKRIAKYRSVADAYEATGIRHISEVARGTRRTAGGYQWEY